MDRRVRILESSLLFKECPFCHRLLAAEQLSREEIDSNEVTTQIDNIPQGTMPGGLGSAGLGIGIGPNVEFERFKDEPDAYITYKVTFRCKDCGKEWTKLEVEHVKIPLQYVEDEAEKTDYDADVEEEEAREEEYARAEE